MKLYHLVACLRLEMTDADAPAAFFKRSKSKNLRTRAAPSSDQSVKDGESVEASPSTLASKLKKQLKERKKPKARLSFGGDEEVWCSITAKAPSLSD